MNFIKEYFAGNSRYAMLIKGAEEVPDNYKDIDENHWAYKYAFFGLCSKITDDNGNYYFYPNS